jgi:hypothetical protein
VEEEWVVMGSNHLSISLGLPDIRVTQNLNFNFVSLCNFGGHLLAANSEGIYLLDQQEYDDGVSGDEDIVSLAEWPRTDFGISNQKKLRKIFVGYKSMGDLTLKVRADEGDWEEYTLEENDTKTINQSSFVVPTRRDMVGRYWEFAITNPGGEDFSVDHIEVMLVVLNKKIRGV